MNLAKLVVAAAAAGLIAAPAGAARQTALVAGASGKTGAQLVHFLAERGFAVRAMVRDRAKGAELGTAVEFVEADVTRPDTLAAAMTGVSYVLSAIGASTATPPNDPENVDYRGVANLAGAAKAAGVRRFVLMSSIGAGNADPESPLNRVFGMVLMWKGKGEESLRSSGVPYTIVRPGGLADCEAGRSGVDLQPGDARVSGRICRGDVALVMIDALTNPAARDKTVAIVGDEAAPAGAWKKQWKRIAAD